MARTRSPKGSKKENQDVLNNPAAATAAPEVQQEMQAAAQNPELVENPRSVTRRRVAAKTDSRMSLVPINLEDEIRRRAYELYAGRGFMQGHETEDWLVAEQEVMQRYRQHSA